MKRLAAINLVALAALGAAAPAMAAADGPSPVRTVVAAARRATAKYHDVNVALKDGYVPVSECVSEPGEGAMGIHYLNPTYAADSAIVPSKPEILLYEPAEYGQVKLVGVEYFKADADQDLSTDGDRPSLAGVPFNGPMLGHGPGMPIHFDLHAWVWKKNPSGLFAQYNPNVHC